jgi:uncharacterized protein YbbK (DUF523 family)
VIVGGDGRDVIHGKARVVDQKSRNVTDFFIRGAEETARLARLTGAGSAVLKERSPSCALTWIDSGRGMIRGCGVTTALLIQEGVEVFSEETFFSAED